MDYRKHARCPHCGGAIIPREIVELGLNFVQSMALVRLLEHAPATLTHSEFGISEKSMMTYVSHVRRAIRDTGSPWRIFSIHGEPPRYFAEKVRKHEARS